jgi:hypothetical protein
MKAQKAKYYSVTANINSDGSISVLAWHRENRRITFDLIPINSNTEREKLNRAAPELLEALEHCAYVIGHNDCSDGRIPNGFAVALDKSRAAIKKATQP